MSLLETLDVLPADDATNQNNPFFQQLYSDWGCSWWISSRYSLNQPVWCEAPTPRPI